MKWLEKFKKYKRNHRGTIYESEIQFVAYSKLKPVFPSAVMEYRIPKVNGVRGARLDIAIFDESDNLILIVEVKRSIKSRSTLQGERYTKLTGVPCIYIRGLQQAEISDRIVKDYLNQSPKKKLMNWMK